MPFAARGNRGRHPEAVAGPGQCRAVRAWQGAYSVVCGRVKKYSTRKRYARPACAACRCPCDGVRAGGVRHTCVVGSFVPDGPRRRAGAAGVLCGEYLSTLRQVLEYFPQSTIRESARRLPACCAVRAGYEAVAPSRKAAFGRHSCRAAGPIGTGGKILAECPFFLSLEVRPSNGREKPSSRSCVRSVGCREVSGRVPAGMKKGESLWKSRKQRCCASNF